MSGETDAGIEDITAQVSTVKVTVTAAADALPPSSQLQSPPAELQSPAAELRSPPSELLPRAAELRLVEEVSVP